MKRLLAILVAVSMIFSVFSFHAIALEKSEMSGTTFSAEYLFETYDVFTDIPLTLETWVKVPSTMTDRVGVIASTYPTISSVQNAFDFEIHEKGRPRVYLVSGGTNYDFIFSNVSVNTGEWVHLAFVIDSENNALECYVDGELKETKTFDGAIVGAIKSGRPMAVGGDHRIGNNVYFKGEIASLCGYSNVRSESDIASDMQNISESSLLFAYDFSEKNKVRYNDLSKNGFDISWGGADLVDKTDVTPVTDYAYSFAVIGDTQTLNNAHPEQYEKMYDWVYDNASKKNIKFIIGMGDITEIRNGDADEWSRAVKVHEKISQVVPYALARGNHDDITSMKNAFPFVLADDGSNGSKDGDVFNSYYKFSVGDIKYLVLLLDYGCFDDDILWAEEVVSQNPDYNVIIATHAYLAHDGEYFSTKHSQTSAPSAFGGNNGDAVFEKLIGKYENIVMVLSGHDPSSDIVWRIDEGKNGHEVPQFLIDPQTEDTKIATGTIAMFYFSEDGRTLKVENYCTLLDCYSGSNSKSLTFQIDTVDETARYNQYSVVSDENGKVTVPSFVPEENGKLFSGWSDESGNFITSKSVFEKNTKIIIKPNYIDFDKDMLTSFVDENGNENDPNPVLPSDKYTNATFLQGAQVRVPIKENKSWGLRFITVFNTDVKKAIENSAMKFERGLVVVSEKDHNFINKLVIDTPNSSKVVAKNIFATTEELKKNYDKYTACVVNIPEEYFDSQIVVRPYFTYVDFSGITHAFYGEQYSCSLYSAAVSAYNATDSNGSYVESDEVRKSLYETIVKKVLGDNDLNVDF